MAVPDGVLRAEQRLGPYDLVREIGRGGFATVWLARQRGAAGDASWVAIKLIRSEFQFDPGFQKSFIDEARLAAAIKHPNVANIVELGEVDKVPYLVMEYVNGQPLSGLRNTMRRAAKPIQVGVLLRIIAGTCAGLHAAHELTRDGKALGVIHRDVSPQNILVSDKGTVKLIDFGVAKSNVRMAADTTYGQTKGKLPYMAPEQVLARPVDRRADVWSVGAVAFDVLEGHPPYAGQNDVMRMVRMIDAAPPPTFATKVPDPIAHVIRKALERDPDARWATAEEMRLAIEAALEACGLRVTDGDVATFFGDALTPSIEGSIGPESVSDAALLRDRLRRPSAQVGAETIDVPAPGDSAAPAIQERGETVPAIDTSAHAVPRRRSRFVVASVAGGLAGFLLVAGFVIGLRRDPHAGGGPPEPSAAAPSARAGEPRALSEPEASGASAPGASSIATPPPAIEPPGAQESASSAPRARPMHGKPKRPRPTKPSPTSPAR